MLDTFIHLIVQQRATTFNVDRPILVQFTRLRNLQTRDRPTRPNSFGALGKFTQSLITLVIIFVYLYPFRSNNSQIYCLKQWATAKIAQQSNNNLRFQLFTIWETNFPKVHLRHKSNNQSEAFQMKTYFGRFLGTGSTFSNRIFWGMLTKNKPTVEKSMYFHRSWPLIVPWHYLLTV